MTPSRLQRKRTAGWRKPEGAVIVDRSSRWGNPWSVARGGGGWCVCRAGRGMPTPVAGPFLFGDSAASRAASLFARYLTLTPSGRALAAAARDQLAGRDLLCWCAPGAPCHADTLLELANAGEAVCL